MIRVRFAVFPGDELPVGFVKVRESDISLEVLMHTGQVETISKGQHGSVDFCTAGDKQLTVIFHQS